jgi:hypothetical protein
MTSSEQSKKFSQKQMGRYGLFVAALVAVVVLFLFNPKQHHFYPTCWFHKVTGLDCAGCGGLRATHQLLHGNFEAAFALNPLLIVVFPIAVLAFGLHLLGCITGKELVRIKLPRQWPWFVLALVIIYTVVRNLPAFVGVVS